MVGGDFTGDQRCIVQNTLRQSIGRSLKSQHRSRQAQLIGQSRFKFHHPLTPFNGSRRMAALG